MRENKDKKIPCTIIEDLLPNYIEGLLSEQTSELVAEHLNSCSKCKKIYEEMQGNLTAEKKSDEKTGEEIKYLKKVKKKMSFWKIVGVVAILFFLYSLTPNFNGAIVEGDLNAIEILERNVHKNGDMCITYKTSGVYHGYIEIDWDCTNLQYEDNGETVIVLVRKAKESFYDKFYALFLENWLDPPEKRVTEQVFISDPIPTQKAKKIYLQGEGNDRILVWEKGDKFEPCGDFQKRMLKYDPKATKYGGDSYQHNQRHTTPEERAQEYFYINDVKINHKKECLMGKHNDEDRKGPNGYKVPDCTCGEYDKWIKKKAKEFNWD